MTFEDACAVVGPFIEMHGQYSLVSEANAETILGPTKLARLRADAIRRATPKPGYFYYWNVADYLRMP